MGQYTNPQNVVLSYRIHHNPTHVLAFNVSSESMARHQWVHDIMTHNVSDYTGNWCPRVEDWMSDEFEMEVDLDTTQATKLADLLGLSDYLSEYLLSHCNVLTYVAFLGQVVPITNRTMVFSCLDG
jgi:hypothetical protein